jgi:hypothetical protein
MMSGALPPWSAGLVALLVAYACSGARYSGTDPHGPTLTFPARFAEAEPTDAGASPASSAGLEAPDSGLRTAAQAFSLRAPPDPEPIRSARYWEYSVTYQAGQVYVTHVAEWQLPRPVVTPRRVGRFAFELWIGHELVDRIRFDFPGLAGEPAAVEGPRPIKEPPTLGKALVASVRVQVPASPRATRALLVDRGTGARQTLPWPPDAPLPPVGTVAPLVDGGVPLPADALDARAEAAD